MSKRKWSFTKANEEDFSEYRKALTEIINTYKAAGKEYDIILQDHEKSKTLPQLAGLHKLFQIIADDFSKEAGKTIGIETVKSLVKENYGLHELVLIKNVNVKQYKSLKNLTLKEMQDIIEYVQSWALTEWGIKDCVLTSAENRALVDYYNNK